MFCLLPQLHTNYSAGSLIVSGNNTASERLSWYIDLQKEVQDCISKRPMISFLGLNPRISNMNLMTLSLSHLMSFLLTPINHITIQALKKFLDSRLLTYFCGDDHCCSITWFSLARILFIAINMTYIFVTPSHASMLKEKCDHVIL